MNKHIHGPLRLIQDSEAWFILDRAGWAVCKIGKLPQPGFTDEIRAYANLFFKAYEMLEIIEALLEDALYHGYDNDACDCGKCGRCRAYALLAELEDDE